MAHLCPILATKAAFWPTIGQKWTSLQGKRMTKAVFRTELDSNGHAGSRVARRLLSNPAIFVVPALFPRSSILCNLPGSRDCLDPLPCTRDAINYLPCLTQQPQRRSRRHRGDTPVEQTLRSNAGGLPQG